MQNSHTIEELSNALTILDAQILLALQAVQDKYHVKIHEVQVFHSEVLGEEVPYLYDVSIMVSVL